MNGTRPLNVAVVDLNGPFGPLSSLAELVQPLAGRVDYTFIVPEQRLAAVSTRFSGTRFVPYEHTRRWEIAAARTIHALEPRPDLVHANSTSAIRSALLTATTMRLPFVAHLRNSELSRGERLLVRVASRLPLRSRFVAVSSAAARVSGLRTGKYLVLPDSVSVHSVRDRRALSDPPIIGAVVNQTPTKGFDVLTGVILTMVDLPCKWRVFGSAAAEDANEFVQEQHGLLRAVGVEDRVEFCGVVDDLRIELPNLDAMLITSRRESFSRVAVESMLSGLPLVAPNIPGLDETVGRGCYTSMYAAANVFAAAAALRRLVSDYSSALDLADTARSYAEEQFGPDVAADRMLDLYEELVSGA